MSDTTYDPACVECRRVAGKDRAGTTWTCYGHLKTQRDEARALLRRCRERVRDRGIPDGLNALLVEIDEVLK